MKSFIIGTEEDWQAWREPWQQLTQANPMLGWEWLHAWWQNYGAGHQLNILAITSDDRLVGVVPWYLHQTRVGHQLRFLGSGSVSSDYLSAVVASEHCAEVYQTIRDYLDASASRAEFLELDSFYLEGLAENDPWLPQLEEFAREHGYSHRLKPMVNSWRLNLPKTWPEYVESMRAKRVFRRAKKCAARLKAGEVNVRFLTHPSDCEEGMQHLIKLHQARRTSIGDDGCFADSRFELFLRAALGAMMERGTAQFSLCCVDKAVIGIQLHLLGEHTAYMYQSGCDPNSMALEPGHLLITATLMRAIERGLTGYDFLRGDEPYKQFWGAEPTMLKCAVLAPPTLKAQTIESVYRKLSWLRTWSNENVSPLFNKNS